MNDPAFVAEIEHGARETWRGDAAKIGAPVRRGQIMNVERAERFDGSHRLSGGIFHGFSHSLLEFCTFKESASYCNARTWPP
jgi:hypothetical protein